MISEGFTITYQVDGYDESGKLLPAGWELTYAVDGEAWCLDIVFRRKLDAVLALAAWERGGITPARFHHADSGEPFLKVAAEALQW